MLKYALIFVVICWLEIAYTIVCRHCRHVTVTTLNESLLLLSSYLHTAATLGMVFHAGT